MILFPTKPLQTLILFHPLNILKCVRYREPIKIKQNKNEATLALGTHLFSRYLLPSSGWMVSPSVGNHTKEKGSKTIHNCSNVNKSGKGEVPIRVQYLYFSNNGETPGHLHVIIFISSKLIASWFNFYLHPTLEKFFHLLKRLLKT